MGAMRSYLLLLLLLESRRLGMTLLVLLLWREVLGVGTCARDERFCLHDVRSEERLVVGRVGLGVELH